MRLLLCQKDGLNIRRQRAIPIIIMRRPSNQHTRDLLPQSSPLHLFLLPTRRRVFYNIKLLEVQYQVLDRLSATTLRRSNNSKTAGGADFKVTEEAEEGTIVQKIRAPDLWTDRNRDTLFLTVNLGFWYIQS
jgi:hypothetical protein